MIEDVGRSVAVEVEVAVVGHVDDRWLVRNRLILNIQCIVVCQHVGDAGAHIAREPAVAVLADQAQHQPVVAHFFNVKDTVLPAVRTAVQTVLAIVLRQLISLSVNGYLSVA